MGCEVILALFVRKDRTCYGYVLTPTGVDPIRHHARNLYTSPNESYPGEHAGRAWELHQTLALPEGFKGTTKDAMDLLRVPTDLSPLEPL